MGLALTSVTQFSCLQNPRSMLLSITADSYLRVTQMLMRSNIWTSYLSTCSNSAPGDCAYCP